MSTFYVLADALSSARDLLPFARKATAPSGDDIAWVVARKDAASLADQIADETGSDVFAFELDPPVHRNGAAMVHLLADLLGNKPWSHLCAAHNQTTLDVLPMLAAHLAVPCITCVEDLRIRDGRTRYLRTVHGGKLINEITARPGPVVVTVQPGTLDATSLKTEQKGRVSVAAWSPPALAIRTKGQRPTSTGTSAFDEADVIVSAGRGVGTQENIGLIRELAAVFPRSAVAGSRLVCDAGWLPHKQQVGLTGSTVRPGLYIACGISGASQHVAGMRESGFVVAVNTDPNAPMFNHSDVCVTEDLTRFIPAVIEAARRR